MRVAVGMKIADKLILSREIILDFLGGHNIITRILRMGVGSRSEKQRHSSKKETLPTLFLKTKEEGRSQRIWAKSLEIG